MNKLDSVLKSQEKQKNEKANYDNCQNCNQITQ